MSFRRFSSASFSSNVKGVAFSSAINNSFLRIKFNLRRRFLFLRLAFADIVVVVAVAIVVVGGNAVVVDRRNVLGMLVVVVPREVHLTVEGAPPPLPCLANLDAF